MTASASRARLVGAAIILAVFVAGAAMGIAVDRAVRPPLRVRTIVGADMSRVLDQLALSPAQRVRAEEIVNRRAPGTEALMRELTDRLHAVSDSVDAELRTILTQQQRARLDSLRSNRTIMLRRKVLGPSGATTTDTILKRSEPSPP